MLKSFIIPVIMLAVVTIAPNTSFATNLQIQKGSIQWVGKKITGQHDGHINIQSGKITKDDKNTFTSVEFIVDMESLTVADIKDKDKNGKLVGHLKSDDFFGTSKFKTSNFKSKSIKKIKDNDYEIEGDLTIKDITKPQKFVATAVNTDGVYSLKAKIVVDRTVYNVRYGSGKFFENLGDKLINDNFDLNISVTAK